VKWRNCPSVNLIPEEAFSGNFSEDPFPESFRKNLLLEDEFLISGSFQKLLPEGSHPECFRKKLLPEDVLLLLEEGSFGSYFLKKKMFYFVIIYF